MSSVFELSFAYALTCDTQLALPSMFVKRLNLNIVFSLFFSDYYYW